MYGAARNATRKADSKITVKSNACIRKVFITKIGIKSDNSNPISVISINTNYISYLQDLSVKRCNAWHDNVEFARGHHSASGETASYNG